MQVLTLFQVTLSPSHSRDGFPRSLEYMEIEIKDVENPDDIRHAFYVNDGTLHARLNTLVSAEEASGILAGLDRGETIRLPGLYTKRQLLDMNAYKDEHRTA
jgi:hypothetical protein